MTSAYPSYFIDDPANPLSNGEVRVGGTWPPGYRVSAGQVPLQFGNAVDNAIDLFNHVDDVFPNWNLDGDRSLAHLTWQFKADKYTSAVEPVPEP